MTLTYLLPTIGRIEYLKWTLASLDAQTAPWKLIALDNASTDGTEYLLRAFCEAHDATYVRSSTRMGDGGGASHRALLDMWDGEGIAAFVHDDDICHPERTERLLAAMGSHDLLVTSMYSFRMGQEAQALAGYATAETPWRCDPSVWGDNLASVVGNTTTPSVAFTVAFKDVPRSTGYDSGADDTLLWFRAARMGLDIGFLDYPVYYYRLHGEQMSATFYTRCADFDDQVARLYTEAAAVPDLRGTR